MTRSATPKTCEALGAKCGQVSDGCGAALQCGSCVAPEVCGGSGVANACGVGLPPDPATIAPVLNGTSPTDFAASLEFLYSGDHPTSRSPRFARHAGGRPNALRSAKQGRRPVPPGPAMNCRLSTVDYQLSTRGWRAATRQHMPRRSEAPASLASWLGDQRNHDLAHCCCCSSLTCDRFLLAFGLWGSRSKNRWGNNRQGWQPCLTRNRSHSLSGRRSVSNSS